MRLIDADELITIEFSGVKFVPREFIDDAPTVDVKPVVRSKWYWDNYKYDWTCYACGWPVDYHNQENPWGQPEYSYCPNCGADMREDKG